MPCAQPDLSYARRAAADAWKKIEPILLGYGLTVDPPAPQFHWMACRNELEKVQKAIEELFVKDACNTF